MRQALAAFLRMEAAGGIVMIMAAALAMLLANSSAASGYANLLALPIAGMDLSTFTQDVLMAIFFFAVGMELKREMKEGVLATAQQRTLPLVAALGGIALPALIYSLTNRGIPEHMNGWAIPTATDIAFAMGVLALLGKHVPASARVFLLAIAIYDDLAAILIIAICYSSGIVLSALFAAAVIFLVLCLYNRSGGSCLLLYLILGAALWHYVHEAGIHSTVAGMLTGLLIPLRSSESKYSPLNHLLEKLHPWVSFAILPLFAFCSAGVKLDGVSLATLQQPLPLGIALGLFLGKQLGIFSTTWAAVKLGYAKRPAGSSWRVLYGISTLAGIGFTMSLFITFLAFDGPALHNAATLGILAGSLLSALLGYALLRLTTGRD